MSAVNFILSLARKLLARESKGITTIPNRMAVESKAGEIAAILQDAGLPLNRADEFIKSEQDLTRILNMIESTPPVMKEVPSGIRSTKSAKIMDMEGKEIDPRSKIMGGKQAETEAEIAERLGRENKESAKRFKDKMKDDPEDMAQGGRAGFDNGGLLSMLDIQGEGSKSGKQQIMGAPEGFTMDNETYNFIINADIPIGEKINLLTTYGRGKGRTRIEKDDQELFLDEGGFKKRGIGLDFNPKAEKGFSGKIMYDPDSNNVKGGITYKFAEGGRTGFSKGSGLKTILNFLNENNPVQAYKKYLESIKTRMKQGKEAEVAGEVIPIAAGGALITNQMKKVLKKMNEEQKKRIEEEAQEELRKDMKKADGGRIGYKIGSIDKARRAFLKAAAGIGGGIAALKTGLLSIGKGADTVKNLPPIKTPVTKLEGTTTQMPDWFPSFVNKFRNEGKAKDVFEQKKVKVSKAEYDKAIAEGKGENYYRDDARTLEYKANNPDHMDFFKLEDTDERIYTTYTNDKVPGVRVDDMDGNVDVMFENEYSQPVSLNYTAPGKKGPETGRADLFVKGEAKVEPKPKGEFVANDVEVYATDPDGGFDTEDVIANTVDDMLEGKTRQMEEYVTGKKTKLSKGEGRVIEAEVRAEQAAEDAAEAAAEAADDFASGGIARMLGE